MLFCCQRTDCLDSALIPPADSLKNPYTGVIVGFNTDEVQGEMEYSNVHLLFFGEGEELISYHYFTDMNSLASTKFLLDNGAYTALAIFNTANDALKTIGIDGQGDTPSSIYLPEVIEALVNLQSERGYPFMLNGAEDFFIKRSIERITIPLRASSISRFFTPTTLQLLYPDETMPDYNASPRHSSQSENPPSRRAIMELYKSGTNNRVLRKELSTEELSSSIELFLMDTLYELRVWSDHTHHHSTDLHYDTENTRLVSVAPKEYYSANSDSKDAFVANYTMSNTQTAVHTIELSRPVARYRIVSHGLQKYDSIAKLRGYPAVGDLSVKISYDGYLPTAYDISGSTLSGAATGYSFSSTPTNITDSSATLASDFILVPPSQESSTTVTITISTPRGEVVAQISDVLVDYRANHLSTIAGDFLTAGMGGGIIIDTEWEDEFWVEF